MGEKALPLKLIVDGIRKSERKAELFGPPDEKISDVEYDSRKVFGKNTGFVAIKGEKYDGHNFTKKLFYEKGCKVFFITSEFHRKIKEEDSPFTKKSTFVVVENTRDVLGIVARLIYGQKSKVIGITGTKGKSSTAKIIAESLTHLGIRCGVLGSLWWKLTTPEAPDTLKIMKYSDFDYMAMEITSVAPEQKRTVGIDFSAGIFLGLGRDHLDIHGTLENYFEAKIRFLRQVKGPIIIRRDEWGRKAEEKLRKESRGKIIMFDDEFEWIREKREFVIKWRGEVIRFRSNFFGRFNGYNFLASYILLRELGFSGKEISEVFSLVRPPKGRMELVHENPDVFVDYAHTPDSLEAVLRELKEAGKIKKENGDDGKLIVVFGCGGMRDKEKRPEMGKIAVDIADKVVITSDNPREEDPMKIIDDILMGAKKSERYAEENVFVEPDRKKAIFFALKTADEKDTVVIAGKGHEEYQIIGKEVIPFSDRNIVEEFFTKTKK